MCIDLEKSCLSCYDMACGISNIQLKISTLESKLDRLKVKLRRMVEEEKPNRVERLNAYIKSTSWSCLNIMPYYTCHCVNCQARITSWVSSIEYVRIPILCYMCELDQRRRRIEGDEGYFSE